jgi:hypothetical protein
MIYAHVFFHLRKRLQTIRAVDVNRVPGKKERLSQAARYMILYPIIYIILTLPIASGRMAAMSGKTLPMTFYCIAGSFLTSCGWLDTLLYTLTRRVFIKAEVPNTAISGNAHTPQSACSSRRWMPSHQRGKDAPTPTNDASWPMSTFASMTVDLKDLSEGSDEGANYSRVSISVAPGAACAIIDSRSGTPSADDSVMRSQQIYMHEISIAAGHVAEDFMLAQRGILSETHIEITSETVDEMLEKKELGLENV